MNPLNKIACQLIVKWLCTITTTFFVACNKVNKDVLPFHYRKYFQQLAEMVDQPKCAAIIDHFQNVLFNPQACIEEGSAFYHSKANYLLIERDFEGILSWLDSIIFLVKDRTQEDICTDLYKLPDYKKQMLPADETL